MEIPKIIHQLWKDSDIPKRWHSAVESVKTYHPDWEYKLWTDEMMEAHVKETHPDLYPSYCQFERNIMRADVFRYLVVNDFGGLYADLDYEFVRPFDYANYSLVLGYEFEGQYGDNLEQIANFVFASEKGHPFWGHIIAELLRSPPSTESFKDVVHATGPGFLTRVFYSNGGPEQFDNMYLAPRPVFNPLRLHISTEKKILINSGITHGFHHGSGSWKERFTKAHLRDKMNKFLRR